MKGSLHNASQSFICRCCKVDRPITDGLNTDLHLDIGHEVPLEKADRPITDGLNTDLHLDIGHEVPLEKVDKFCYLGDTLDADGRCDSAVTI